MKTLLKASTLLILTLSACVQSPQQMEDDLGWKLARLQMKSEQGPLNAPWLIQAYPFTPNTRTGFERALDSPDEFGFKPFYYHHQEENFYHFTIDQVLDSLPPRYPFYQVYVIDSISIVGEQKTIVCIDIPSKRWFRFSLTDFAKVENNLTISNLGFDDFYLNCDENHVYQNSTSSSNHGTQGGKDFTITQLAADKNQFNGNLIVEVFDRKGNPLKGATVRVYYKSKIVSAAEDMTESLWVTTVFSDPYEVIVSKAGYEEVVTDKISLNEKFAHLVQVRMHPK